MSERPDVSIVVPCYNAADTVHDTLASLRMQTHPNWEAICVDDGSTDSTGDLLDFAATEDERIRVVRAPHGGLASARNHAMPHVRSDRVVFLDADDVLRPNALDILFRAAKLAGPDSLVAAGAELLDRHARPLSIYRFPHVPRLTVPAVLRGCGLTVTTLIPRRLLGDAPFDASIPICEDTDFWLRLADRGAECLTVPRVIFGRRLRSDSLGRKLDQRFASARQIMERWLPRLPDPADGNDVLRRLACNCSVMALAAGETDSPWRFFDGLPVPEPPDLFTHVLAHALYWGIAIVRGAEGLTWRRHAMHWLPSVRRWLSTGPLTAHAVPALAALDELIERLDESWQRSRTVLSRRTDVHRAVVYGLGRNAAELLELLRSEGAPTGLELSGADDHVDQQVFHLLDLGRDDPRRWSSWPKGTIVLVTPNDAEAMCRTLIHAGGRPDEDFLCLTRQPQIAGAGPGRMSS
ncbi:MAG: glycosyltransferase family 2 protein [Phycisphaerae bacterium]|nr:glycosyltransferase family 2 protein [Phycisphaerae bacterium]